MRAYPARHRWLAESINRGPCLLVEGHNFCVTHCIRTEFIAGTIYFRTVAGVEKLEALFQLECWRGQSPMGAARGNAAEMWLIMKAYLSLDFMLLLYTAARPSLLPQPKPHPKGNKGTREA